MEKNYNTIVISGGALKGFAILGCLQLLVDQQKLQSINKYIATSIGAIISYLIIIGYSPIEIMVNLCKNDWLDEMAKFDILKAINGCGAISFSLITDILEKMTIEKIGRLITIGELYTEFHKELYCCTYNFSKKCHEFINPHDNKNIPCLIALRMTSNLPILFEPFLYESSYYIDGALLYNFPVFYVDLDKDKAIGIKFKTHTGGTTNFTGKNFFNFLYELLIIPSLSLEEFMNKDHVEKVDIIEIDLSGIQCLNFNISKSDRLEFFSNGYETAYKFFHNVNIHNE